MQELYRMIPKVDFFMEKPEMRALICRYGRAGVLEALRGELRKLRSRASSLGDSLETGAEKTRRLREAKEELEEKIGMLPKRVEEALDRQRQGRLRRVINATGTMLHTNLGRAPLSGEILEKAAGRLTGYCNLEYDLEEGGRGERCGYLESLLCRLTGAQAALVVNNNAAAVLLTLSALAAGKEVVVSRGELVEIGGKFRIPEVITQGGARLREVGTTNKTRLEDYQEALGPETGVVLKVHPSNFLIRGFTESVPAGKLSGLGVPLVWDLGSGALYSQAKGKSGAKLPEESGVKLPEGERPFQEKEPAAALWEPTVKEAVSQGADVVCFSGDKLFGGPQAGIILGRGSLIDRIRRHPLMRAVRIGKLTRAVLETVLEEYEKGEDYAREHIPVLSMMGESSQALLEKGERLGELTVKAVKALAPSRASESECRGEEGMKQESDSGARSWQVGSWRIKTEACCSLAGGGTLPGRNFPGAGLAIAWQGKQEGRALLDLSRRLRRREELPVITRTEQNRLILDVRTIFEEEIPQAARILAQELARTPEGAPRQEKGQGEMTASGQETAKSPEEAPAGEERG